MGWLAEVVALAIASAFAGVAFYVNFAEHPARMTLPAPAALAQWKPSYAKGALMQASLALLGSLAAFAAAYASQDLRWALAGAVLLAAWPYTLFVIMPVNNWLKAAATEGAGDEAGRVEEAVKVDPVVVALGVEEVHEVLGREVAGRARGVRAATGAAGRRVERAHAGRETR